MPNNYRWPPQQRLRILLAERNVTRTWLAQQAGVSLVVVSGIVSGRVRPSPRVRGLIAQALDVPSGWLFQHLDDPTDQEMAEAAEPQLWRTMPPIDDDTLQKLRHLLFPPSRSAQAS